MPLMLILGATQASGHDVERTQVVITFDERGGFVLDISNDPAWLLLRLESFAGGQVPIGMTAETRDARLRELSEAFIDRVVLFVDGHEIRAATAEYLPPRPSTLRQAQGRPEHCRRTRASGRPELVEGRPAVGADVLPPLATFRLRGRMPADARTLRWLYGLVIDPYPLTVRRADGGSLTEWIEGSDWSRSVDLSGQFRRASRWQVARDYVALGYTHILPKGLDHILFVLGLFLLSVRLRPLIIQITTFTIAHSITLGLTMYGVIALPTSIVEPLIALSIVYVAVENLATSQLKPWRLALVFMFGLLHGMGFAGVLADLRLPRPDFAAALLSFNLGVEAGQLSVIAIAALCVIWYRHRPWYHQRVVAPASLVIALVGAYWTVTRVLA